MKLTVELLALAAALLLKPDARSVLAADISKLNGERTEPPVAFGSGASRCRHVNGMFNNGHPGGSCCFAVVFSA